MSDTLTNTEALTAKIKQLEAEIVLLQQALRKKKPDKPNSTSRMWTCDACDITIKYGCRFAHKKCKRHLIATGQIKDTSFPREKWYCKVCDKSITKQGRKFHLTSMTHCANAGRLA